MLTGDGLSNTLQVRTTAVQPSSAVDQHFFGKMILETGEERPVSVIVFKKRGDFLGVMSSSGFVGMQFASNVQIAHEYLIAAP